MFEDEVKRPVSKKAEKSSLTRLKDGQNSYTQAPSVPLLSAHLQSLINTNDQPSSLRKRSNSSKRKRISWGDEKTGGSLVEVEPETGAKESLQAAAARGLKEAAETLQRPDKVEVRLVTEVPKIDATGTKVTLQAVAADVKGLKKAAVEQLQSPESKVVENSVEEEKTSMVEVVRNRKKQITKN